MLNPTRALLLTSAVLTASTAHAKDALDDANGSATPVVTAAVASDEPSPSGGQDAPSSTSESAKPAAAPSPAPASAHHELGDNMLGGRVVTHNQLVGTFGYPDLEVGVHLPLFHKFDLTPTFRFAYGQALSPGVPSLAVGVQARWQLLEAGDLTGSLVASQPFTVGLPPFGYASGFGGLGYGVSFGLGLLHPGFMMTYVIADKVDLDFGLQFNDDLVFGGGTVTFVGSVPVIAGAEANITKDLRVGGRMEGGPYFVTGPGGTYVTGYVRVVAGVGWTF